MKVKNLTSPRSGKEVPNQFIIEGEQGTLFQSYESAIVLIDSKGQVHLSSHWDYSVTTSKYRNEFLGETTKEIKDKIQSGKYVIDLDYKTGEILKP